MKKSKIINKLEILTLEADMLIEILYEALRHKEAENQNTSSACYLLEILQRKFRKIRDLF